MKRKLRRGIEAGLPLLGMGIIFGSVLFGPADNLQLQVILLLIGVLILEAGVWGLTSGLLPNERHYQGLREEGDRFIGLIRTLNAAALARKEGQEDDTSFRDCLAEMHTSVERMAELAGKTDAELPAEAGTEAEAEPATEATAEPAGRGAETDGRASEGGDVRPAF